MSQAGAHANPRVVHRRAPVPLRFPTTLKMPEHPAHLRLRTFLFLLVRHILGPEHSVGSDQFVYWAPTDPRRCLAPDLFVKLGVKERLAGSWKCWEHGAPDLAVEVVSASDATLWPWKQKLTRHEELGVKELLRFDRKAPQGKRLRAWDRIQGDFVERVVTDDRTPCLVLGLEWVVRPVEEFPVGLRLADGHGVLVPTELEEAQAARSEAEASHRGAEAARKDAEAARHEAEAAREAAEARVRALEEELRARGG